MEAPVLFWLHFRSSIRTSKAVLNNFDYTVKKKIYGISNDKNIPKKWHQFFSHTTFEAPNCQKLRPLCLPVFTMNFLFKKNKVIKKYIQKDKNINRLKL